MPGFDKRARLALGARASSDPDGQPLRFEWFYYGEPISILLANGRTGAPLAIEDHNKATAGFVAPKVDRPPARRR
jgi:YD repeat-containing protein